MIEKKDDFGGAFSLYPKLESAENSVGAFSPAAMGSRISVCHTRGVGQVTVKSVDVHRVRAEKAEKVQPFTLACFSGAQQHKVIVQTLGRAICANNLPESSKRFDRVFGIVVVPRYPVVSEESEQPVPIFRESSPVASGHLSLIVALRQRVVEPGN